MSSLHPAGILILDLEILAFAVHPEILAAGLPGIHPGILPAAAAAAGTAVAVAAVVVAETVGYTPFAWGIASLAGPIVTSPRDGMEYD